MVQAKVTVEEPSVTSEIEKIPIKIIASQGSPGEPGAKGEDGFSPTVETSKTGRTTTITITDVNGTHTATILDGADGTGSGDMSKSTYDTNNNGIVDNAEKVNSHTVNDDVPSGFFTGAAEATYEGTNITLTDAIDLKSVELKGDTEQDGTPTPDTPVNVQVVTGTQTVVVTGKNLFNKNSVSLGRNWSGTTGSTCYPFSTQSTRAVILIPVKPNTTYNFHLFESEWYSMQIMGVTSEYVVDVAHFLGTSIETTNQLNRSFTTTANTAYVGVKFKYGSAGTTVMTQDLLEELKLQLEAGSTATTYEPYQSQSYTINLGSTELCKIGDYQDYIYKSGNDWYVHKAIEKIIFDGSVDEDWAISYTGTQNYFYRYHYISDYMYMGSGRSEWVNSMSRPASVGSTTTAWGSMITNVGELRIRYGEEMTIAAWRAKLSTTNMVIYYIVSTPTDTKITNTTLIGQLEALAAATIYTNGTMASSGTLPAIISAETLLQTRSGMVEAIANAGTTYTAGTGISITNGVISCTFADGDTEEY